jgi:C4-dicarboxylate-specific signal transduction histidine kinase
LSAQGRALFGIADSGRIDFEGFLASVHAEDRARLRTALMNAPRDTGAFEHEVRVIPAGGAVHWLAVRGQFDRGGSGALGVLRGVAIDVTARRRLEREAAQRHGELAHLSRVATLGALSGSLAHEINQPLMGILSNAQAAQRFLESGDAQLDEVRAILADIVEDDKRAGDVIRRMRALLKKGEVRHAPVDIRTVIDDVLRLTRNDLINRDVSAVAACADEMPPVLGDHVQLQQVLLNLVVNACDAMDGVELRKLTIDVRRRGKELEVAVTDRGTGIAAADLERIFEPFVTAKEHGMGIGLSVCRAIVAAHGGRMWAENNPDGGATFRFTLPIAGAAG